MAFTAITSEDICTQEGTGAFNYIASGTILAGQAVEILASEVSGSNGLRYVIATDSKPAHGFVGVADTSESKGSMVAVWGPGNIVWSRASGGSVAAGDRVVATVDGEFQDEVGGSGAVGVAITTQGTTDGMVQILLG